jgi:hypothetical protein
MGRCSKFHLQVMDSLPVNLFVIILVMIDLSTILYYLLSDSTVPSEDELDKLEEAVMQDQLNAAMGTQDNAPALETEAFYAHAQPTWMFALSLAVVSCLLIDLTLRQIGQGNRFWKNRWNVFDTVVLWLSIIAIIIRKIADTVDALGMDSVVVLRVISRVAVVLRVMRVIINLRRINKLGGHIRKKFRSIVSQNKR